MPAGDRNGNPQRVPKPSREAAQPAKPAGSARDRVRVLGIDPGSLRLGYGVIDCQGPARLDYVECGVISAPARMARAERLMTIGRGLRDLVEELRPDEVAMEQAFFGKNVQSTLVLGEARGMVTFLVTDRGLPLSGYAPARVKRAIVGHGAATKQQIGYLVRALLSLRRAPEPDAADALAIAICHARARGTLARSRK